MEDDADRDADDRTEREADGGFLGREAAFSTRTRTRTGCPFAAGSQRRLTMSCSGGIAYSSTLNGHVHPVER